MQLKTLFLSSKTAESVTVIPALPFSFDETGKNKRLFITYVIPAIITIIVKKYQSMRSCYVIIKNVKYN